MKSKISVELSSYKVINEMTETYIEFRIEDDIVSAYDSSVDSSIDITLEEIPYVIAALNEIVKQQKSGINK